MSQNMIKQSSYHAYIGNTLLKREHLHFFNGKLYIYNNGVYSCSPFTLNKKILSLDFTIKSHCRKEILEYIMIQLSDDAPEINSDYINFKNCLYNIPKREKQEHSASIFTINQLNVAYTENISTNKYIEKFLNDITCNNPDRKQAILQIIGYSMTSSVALQKAFIFLGETAGNGKSTLLEIIDRLIGKENISKVSIHDLQNGRFYAAELENKLLNTVAELPRNILSSIDIFKDVVTGDELSFEEKYKDRHIAKPYAKHIFTANELPKISDLTNGLYRRLFILPFEAQFTDEQKRQFDINKLISQDALDYLAMISLKAYLELLENGKFSNETESEMYLKAYKSENDSVLSFIEDFMQTHFSPKRIDKNALYKEYLLFCKAFHYPAPLGRNTFYNKIISTKLFSEITINGKRLFRYIGATSIK